jgi:hypothetical protein
LLPLHVSPSVAHEPPGFTHVPFEQLLPQHSTLLVQLVPATLHVVAVEHLSVCGSQ